MSLDLAVIQEVVIDDSKALAGAARVVAAQERMADASEASSKKQLSGLALVDAATGKLAGAQESAVRRLNVWKAAADDNERVMQRLARAEADLDRARKQGLISQDEQIKLMGQLEQRLRGLQTANDNAGRTLNAGAGHYRNFGSAVQQAGFQVGDFAVQVASGQGVLRPFIQQGTQLISMFGPWGAAIGAVGAVAGALAVTFLDVEDAAKKWTTAQESLNKVLEKSNNLILSQVGAGAARQKQLLEETKKDIETQIGKETDFIAAAEEERRRLQVRFSGTPNTDKFAREATQQIADLDDKIKTATSNVYRLTDAFAELENGPRGKAFDDDIAQAAQMDKDRLAALERGKKLIEELGQARKKSLKEEADEEVKRQKLINQHESDRAAQMDRDRLAAGKRGEEIVKSYRDATDNLEDYIRKLEDAATVDGRTTQEKKIQQAIIEAQNKLYDKQGNSIRDLDQAERDRIATAIRQTDELEMQRKKIEGQQREIERVVQRTTDQLVDFGGSAIFDRLIGRATNFWDTVKDYGLRVFSQLAAELALRPLATALTADIEGAAPVQGIFR